MMTLREYLSIPYLLEARSIPGPQGGWIRELSYPELGDCVETGTDVERMMTAIDVKRYQIILRRWQRGEPIPVPRAPLHTTDVPERLRAFGLDTWIHSLDVDNP